jgi:hypothetical protein
MALSPLGKNPKPKLKPNQTHQSTNKQSKEGKNKTRSMYVNI